MNIGVLGLGKLGLPLACVYANAGHDVWVWDSNEEVRKAITGDVLPDIEPGVHELFHKVSREERLALCDPPTIGVICDVAFVVVPTPSMPTGEFSDEHVRAALASLCPGDEGEFAALYRQNHKPLHVVIVSTVSPGTCDRLIGEIPSNMKLSYAPTFIALGEVLHHLTDPVAQLIGAADPRESAYVETVLRSVAPRGTYRHMSLISAELGKITFNAFMTLKIVFSNIVGQICDNHRGADVDDVLETISLDPRISGPLSRAGGAYGGPCLPRDNRAFARAAGLIDTLAAQVHESNRRHTQYIAYLAAEGKTTFSFAVLGMSYKDGVEYHIESFGAEIAEILTHLGGTEADTTQDADVVVIAMPLRDHDLHPMINPTARVIDVWRTHDYLKSHVRDYVAFGRP